MKKKTRNFIVLILSICFVAISLQGCGNNPSLDSANLLPIEGKNDDNAIVGGFVETVLQPASFDSTKYRVMGVFVQNDGTVDLFTFHDEAKPAGQIEIGKDYMLFHYQSIDSGITWQEKNVDWFYEISKIPGMNSQPFIKKITMDNKQNIFCTVQGDDKTPKIIKVTQSGDLEVLELSNTLNDKAKPFRLFTTDADGNYLVIFGNGEAVLFNKDSNKKIASYQNVSPIGLAACNNSVLQITPRGEIYKIEDGKSKPELISSISISQALDSKLLVGSDGAVYVIAHEGIYRLSEDNTMIEQLLDGSYHSLGTLDQTIEYAAVNSETKTFYAVVRNQSGQDCLLKYHFDKNLKIEKKKTLTVFSMSDNDFIKRSIIEYQKRNPDTKILFQVGKRDAMALTDDDIIKKLNTELLAGKGPDVLILDELPVHSYLEKNIFLNLNESIDFNNCFNNVTNAFTDKDKNIYAVPTRFSCSLIVGKNSLLSTINSLEDFEKIVINGPELPENAAFNWDAGVWDPNNLPIGLVNSFADPVKMFYPVCYPNLLTENNQLSSVELGNFLAHTKNIYNKYKVVSLSDDATISDFDRPNYSFDISVFKAKSSQLCVLENASIAEIVSAMNPVEGKISADTSVKLLPSKDLNVFYPKTIIGINQASKLPDEAIAFLSILLEPNVQANDSEMSFPVNEEAFNQLLMKSDLDLKQINLSSIVNSLKTPVIPDKFLLNQILLEVPDFYDNKSTLENTVQKIEQKTSTYLSEQKIFKK